MWKTIENCQVLMSSDGGVKEELTPHYLWYLYLILHDATTWEYFEFRYLDLFEFYITCKENLRLGLT